MEAVLRAAAVYIALLVFFRLSGRRTLAQMTSFDFVMLLIIGESVQNGLLGSDFSLVTALLTVLTLIVLDVGLSFVKQLSPGAEKVLDGVPCVVVEDGKPIADRMGKARIDEGDVLEAAREKMGLERMDQIKYAVLEKSGEISIVPRSDA